MGAWAWFKNRVEHFIEDPTDNVNTTQVANPFVVKESPAPVHYAVGKTFGETSGSDQFTAVELWASGDLGLVHVGLKNPDESKPSFLLAAVTNGMLRLVPEGSSAKVPGTDRLPGGKVTVQGPAYILEGLQTAVDSLRIAMNADVWIEAGMAPPNRPVPSVIVYENIEVNSDLDELVEGWYQAEKKQPWWTDARIGELVTAWKAGENTVYVRAGHPIGHPRDTVPAGVSKPAEATTDARYVKVTVYDEFGQPIDLGWLLRHVDMHAENTIFDSLVGPNVEIFRKDPVRGKLPVRDIIDLRDEYGLPYRNQEFRRVSEADFPPITSVFDIEEARLQTQNPLQTTGQAGIWRGSEVTASSQVTIQGVGISDHLLSFLPSCPSSSVFLKLRGYAGDYHRVIAFPLNKWFPEQPNARAGMAPKRFHLGCRVTPLIDGQSTHASIANAIRATYERIDDDPPDPAGLRPPDDIGDSHIWLCNWAISPDTFPYGGSQALYDSAAQSDSGNPDFHSGQFAYPEASLGFYLQSAIAAGADVRLMPWFNMLGENARSQNVEIVRAVNGFYDLNAYHSAQGLGTSDTRNPQDVSGMNPVPANLRRGHAFVDDKTRGAGSHHQKVSYVRNRYGDFAFLGGIDLVSSRWDSTEHREVDERRGSGKGWHDIHAMLEGPVVQDVILNFTQRWNAFLASPPDATSNYPVDLAGITDIANPPLVPEQGVPDWPGATSEVQPDANITPHALLDRGAGGRRSGRGTHACAIVRTIPEQIDAYDSFVKARPIPDDGSPLGELGCRAAYVKAIENARQYIYLEDQYFVDPELTQLMIERLTDSDPRARLQRLFVVVPHILNDDPLVDAIYHHFRTQHSLQIREAIRAMLGTERGVGPETIPAEDVDKIFTVAHLQHPTGNEIYLHAKHMIVDDLWMMISSSNFSRRGMTFESEIGITVTDAEIENGARKVVRDHRIRLWAEHLKLGRSSLWKVLNPIKGAELLRKSLVKPKYPLIPFEIENDNIPFRYDPEDHTNQLELIYDLLGDVDGRETHDPIDVETARNLLETLIHQ